MKQASKYFIPAALAILTLAGCQDEADNPEVAGSSDFPRFSATIVGSQSRAYDQYWEMNDQISITGGGRTNVCFITNKGDGNFVVKNKGEQIYFKDDKEIEFTASYPWNNLPDGTLTVNTDTKDQSNQKNFDFLWAKATGKKTVPNVNFQFSHIMSKLLLTVKPGNEMSYEEIKNSAIVKLNGLRQTGSFNIADGTISNLSSEAQEVDFSNYAQFNDEKKSVAYSLIFFPQILEKPLDFTAEIMDKDNRQFILKASIDFTQANGEGGRNELVQGRQYNLTVTLNKSEVNIDKCEISNWKLIEVESIIVD